MSRFISIRWKLLSIFVGLVLVVVVLVLIGVSQQVQSRIVADINNSFVEKGRLFERIQQVRFRQLRQTAILLADAPSLKAAISTNDVNTVNQKIQDELLPLLDFDPVVPDSLIPESYYSSPDSGGLLIVCNSMGYPVGQLATTPLPMYSIAERPGVSEALRGQYPMDLSIWKEGDRYFNVASVPIWLGDTVMGSLSYGYPIRKIEVIQLARDMESEIVFFVDNQIIANSFGSLLSSDNERLAQGIYDASYQVIKNEEATTFNIRLMGERWLVYVTSMVSNVTGGAIIPGFYVVARSYTEAAGPLRRLQSFIFLLGVGAVLLSVIIAIALTNRINRPVVNLVKGIEEMKRGNYRYSVPVSSNDEFGLLTTTFNTLIANLRERLEMLKFVSTATLDAIEKNLSEILPGGERKEVTVFFSDIRGFTAWSEKRPPEEVIKMLNTCLSVQADIIQQHHGDIDKFVGDEVVAVFAGPGRERHAVSAAVQIQHTLTEMMGAKTEQIAVGIGINTGVVVMGAMGSESRMDYTVIGNHVNLGARLCTAAAPGQILVSEWTAENIERKIPIEPLEPLHFKGIEEPVKVFEVQWRKVKILDLMEKV